MKKIKSLSNNRIVRLCVLWLVPFLILTSFLVVEFLNHYNYLEIFPKELIFPMATHALTALLIALVIYFIPYPKLYVGKFIAGVVIGFAFVGYQNRLNNIAGIYRAILPFLPSSDKDMPIISLAFIITIFAFALFVGVLVVKLQKKSKQLRSSNVIFSLIVVIGFIFVSQLLRVSSVLPVVLKQSIVKPTELGSQINTPSEDKPDIYYIVLDRYASSSVLKDQFNYNNQKFMDFLQKERFFINQKATSNYPLTTASISSTINANYTNESVKPYVNQKTQSRTLYHNLIRQSSVVNALKQNGYKYYHIGSTYGASNSAPLADEDMTYATGIKITNKFNKRLSVFEFQQFYQSPYYSFANIGLAKWPLQLKKSDNDYYVYEQLEALNNLVSKTPGGRFVFAHILVPHDPFTFNADGSILKDQGTDSYGKPIKEKYLGQTQFITDQIKPIVKKINEQTGGSAVILLNTDEGPYPWDMAKIGPGNYESVNMADLDFSNMSDDWTKMKYGILQAVQIPKASAEDLKNLNSVNMFRIVLNNYLGYKLDYLPYCTFGFNQGDKYEYKYQDITGKLVDNYDKYFCSQHQSL